jgi:hypothetical protein
MSGSGLLLCERIHPKPVVEFDRTHNPLRDELLSDQFFLEQGTLLVPQGPGLGVTVNDNVLVRYGAERWCGPVQRRGSTSALVCPR